MIKNLPSFKNINIDIQDTIQISKDINISENENKLIYNTAKLIMPWRKGPFKVFDTFIDSEWKSYIKYNLLKPFFDLKNKIVGDIGCNNGYYLFRMLEDKPKKLIGFDPSIITYCQFEFINHFIKSNIKYELLGVEHLKQYEHKFDILLCLGVLYHRTDPIKTLKSLYKGLNKNGELILDTLIIDGEDEICLTPNKYYSKIPNIYFIPTINALKNWCYRAKFQEIQLLKIVRTNLEEQHQTEWINSQSLNNFLNPLDETKTIEGYTSPKRAYFKLIKI